MVQTPVEYDPDPEPDIRRFSSSQQQFNNNQDPTFPAPDRALSTPPTAHFDTQHGVPDSRIERRPPILHVPQAGRPNHGDGDDDEKSSDQTAHVNPTPNDKQYPATVGDKLESDAADLPVSRSSSKRPKARDFAVTNIAAPIRRATEKLVPAKRNPGQQDVAFALPPATSRPVSPSPSATAAKARATAKFFHGGPGFKQSFKVSLMHACMHTHACMGSSR